MSCSASGRQDCTAACGSAPTDSVPITVQPKACSRCKGYCIVCGGDAAAMMRMFNHGITMGRRLEREAHDRS